MDYITPNVVAVAAYNVCQRMQANSSDIPEWTEVCLLIGTAAVESEFSAGAKGTRLGPFGLDVNIVKELYEGLQPYTRLLDHRRWTKANSTRRSSWKIFSQSWLGVNNVPYFRISSHDMRHLICHDLMFGAAMCRWVYLNILVDKCENLPALAEAWSLFYKALDDRTEADFLAAWTDNECEVLMQMVGYN